MLMRELYVEWFKSIRRLRIPLEPGVRVLVGANASGKTNILEAAHFIYKAFVEAPQKLPYQPHAPTYWSPLDIFHGKDPSRPIVVGIGSSVYLPLRGGGW
nr:AAA family ATPase [Desulfurococcales archaeon]